MIYMFYLFLFAYVYGILEKKSKQTDEVKKSTLKEKGDILMYKVMYQSQYSDRTKATRYVDIVQSYN